MSEDDRMMGIVFPHEEGHTDAEWCLCSPILWFSTEREKIQVWSHRKWSGEEPPAEDVARAIKHALEAEWNGGCRAVP